MFSPSSRSLLRAFALSLLAHAVLLAGSQPRQLGLAPGGQRIDARLVVRAPQVAPPLPQVAVAPPTPSASPVGLASAGPSAVPAPAATERIPRRERKASVPTAPAQEPAVSDGTPEGVSSEALNRYRLSLALAARSFTRYPELARARGWQGTVELALEAPAGAQPRWRLLHSSGNPVLDAQAQEMLERAALLAPRPEALARRDFRLTLTVRFGADETP